MPVPLKRIDANCSIAWRRGVVVLLVLIVTYGILKFYVPRRIAFAFHREAFMAHVPDAIESEYNGEPLEPRLGIYHVDAFAKDPRGGVYFRTATSADWIDTISWGFVYNPNPRGSPFGDADYAVRPLGEGWYWFTASNDY